MCTTFDESIRIGASYNFGIAVIRGFVDNDLNNGIYDEHTFFNPHERQHRNPKEVIQE